jgi:membrane protein YdbS with pleckstrin-like domain
VIDVELRQPANLVSRRAPAYWTVRALTGWVVVLAVEIVSLAGSAPASVAAAVLAPTAAVALTHLGAMPRWRFRVHRWEITETAVYTQSGWFTQERRVAPIARVQTVDTQRGPLEQLFGLANLTVTTASAKGPLKIHALDLHTAEGAAYWLTEHAQRAGGDGT